MTTDMGPRILFYLFLVFIYTTVTTVSLSYIRLSLQLFTSPDLRIISSKTRR
jgi:hypothetical protein